MIENSAPSEISTQPNEVVSDVPCAFCRRQFSRYTCPQCNAPYCSLTCFRSEAHASCSETFYRKELESDVQSSPSKTSEERRRMMELLKHFEEDTINDGDLSADSDEEDEDLARRLGDTDLEAASFDELWAALTPAERDRFQKAIGDPNSELAQTLLGSEELEKACTLPWWEAPAGKNSDDMQVKQPTQSGRPGVKPNIMQLPASMVSASSPAGKGPLLLYNLCAICIAYAYVTRHFFVSPLSTLPYDSSERSEAQRTIAQLVPFLTDRKSTMVHSTLSSVVTDLWSRFEPGSMKPAFFSLLLRDAATLLRPSAVTMISPISNDTSHAPLSQPDGHNHQLYLRLDVHQSSNILRVLSDLQQLFDGRAQFLSSVNASPSSLATQAVILHPSARLLHVPHKLTFYTAHVLGVPSVLLHALADEAASRAEIVAREEVGVGAGGGPEQDSQGSRLRSTAREKARGSIGKPGIEELT